GERRPHRPLRPGRARRRSRPHVGLALVGPLDRRGRRGGLPRAPRRRRRADGPGPVGQRHEPQGGHVVHLRGRGLRRGGQHVGPQRAARRPHAQDAVRRDDAQRGPPGGRAARVRRARRRDELLRRGRRSASGPRGPAGSRDGVGPPSGVRARLHRPQHGGRAGPVDRGPTARDRTL
ncbi:MAG: GH119, partial [uncultured Thermoleophilia bacterium]